MDNNTHDPFEYYIEPKNGWEVIRWAMQDSLRLRRYVESLKLSRMAERKLFLRYYVCYLMPWVLIRVVAIWLLGLWLVAVLDLPNITAADWWEDGVVTDWQGLEGWWAKWGYLLQHQWKALFDGLFGGLIFGLIFGLFFDSSYGLFFGLFGGLFLGLVLGLAFGLENDFFDRLNTGGFIVLIRTSLLCLLIFCLIWFYYFMRIFYSNFNNSLYLKSGEVLFSFLGEKKMIRQAQADPSTAFQFCKFLFTNRRYNDNLAALIYHAANGKIWEDAALNLEDKRLELPSFEVKGFTIPDTWHQQLTTVRSALVTAETATQISIQKRLYEGFIAELDKLYQITLNPYPKPIGFREHFFVPRYYDWHEFYRTALREWKRIAAQELAKIQKRAAEMEPTAPNLYKTGDKLSRTDQAVYIERTDLREHLSRILHTSNGFSVILLQGQRRVGKTSLLTFLPEMLGRRYAIAYYDLQGNVASVPDFLVKLRQTVNNTFRIQEEQPWQPPEGWSAALGELYAYAGELARTREVRLILALDEYETLHRHLQANEAAGSEFLATFRHWNQKQVDISVMWIGLKFFSELQHPNWSGYFVEAIPIQVPYLNRAETDKLLDVSTLRFAPGLRDRLYHDTQGHPALVQKIGFALVHIANGAERKDITFEDYEAALKRMIFITDNGVMDQFYSLNCETEVDKGIAWAVLEGKPIPKEHQHRLRRLVEYGFFVPEGEGYRYRVPLFEQWMNMHFVAYQPL